MSKLLKREDLLKKKELKIEKVELEEGYVYVREMTAAERDTFERLLYVEIEEGDGVRYERNTANFRSKLAVMTICNENGERLLKEEDYEAFSQAISAKEMELIVNKALSLNRMKKEDVEKEIKN